MDDQIPQATTQKTSPAQLRGGGLSYSGGGREKIDRSYPHRPRYFPKIDHSTNVKHKAFFQHCCCIPTGNNPNEMNSGDSMAWTRIRRGGLLNLMGNWMTTSKPLLGNQRIRRTGRNLLHGYDETEDNLLEEEERQGASNHMDAFQPDTGGYYFRKLRAFEGNSGSDDGTLLHSNVSGLQHASKEDKETLGTPAMSKSPANPYNTGQTPLTDKYLRQCNDFYLYGSLGLTDADDFNEDYYSVLCFPPS
jgi:hypothetical protein